MARTRIFLNASDYTLAGKYKQSAEHVHCICDSVIAFTVTLPDLFSAENKEFVFHNIPSSGSGGNITIATATGQLINGKDITHTLIPYDSATFVSDMKSMWLLLDINQ